MGEVGRRGGSCMLHWCPCVPVCTQANPLCILQDQGISTFEFINSGVAEALLGYLTQRAPASATEAEKLAAAECMGRRVRGFVELLERRPKAMTTLLQYLEQSLSIVEKFPTHSECFAQVEGSQVPVLRSCASLKECLKILGGKVFRVRLINGDVPASDATQSEGKRALGSPDHTQRGKSKEAPNNGEAKPKGKEAPNDGEAKSKGKGEAPNDGEAKPKGKGKRKRSKKSKKEDDDVGEEKEEQVDVYPVF